MIDWNAHFTTVSVLLERILFENLFNLHGFTLIPNSPLLSPINFLKVLALFFLLLVHDSSHYGEKLTTYVQIANKLEIYLFVTICKVLVHG